MTTGEKIRKRRFELGLKSKDVADRAGITASYLSAVEKGKRRGKGKLEDIANALECSLSDIEPDAPNEMVCPADDDFGAICNCAVRYCLGRRSYMPKLVTDYIILLLPKLTEKTLACFQMDIEDRKKTGFDFGMDCDVETWERFYKAVCDEAERRRTSEL